MANADIVITTDPNNQVTIESLIDQNDLVLNDVATMRNIAIGKLADAVSTMSLNLEIVIQKLFLQSYQQLIRWIVYLQVKKNHSLHVSMFV